jgi:hypothetical protein
VNGGIMELIKDGSLFAGQMIGTYSVDWSDTIWITTDKPVKGKTKFKSKVSISNDVMTWTDDDGTKASWRRVK